RPSGKARGEATSAAYSSICEHWREPSNAEWRPQAQFFNSLLKHVRYGSVDGWHEIHLTIF
ncbi:MAG TPA: hypothetical protein PKV75_05545, partial [Desulfobacterales bacterium]|nr:hypothetical protein [Desulfobacterales bacterium]